jgi:hypothetical protein
VPDMDLKRMIVYVFIGSLLIMCLALEAHGGCTKDTDCKGDRICVDGDCVDPSPKAGSRQDRRPRRSADFDSEEDMYDEPTGRYPATPQRAAICVTPAGSCTLFNVVSIGSYCVCFSPYGQIPGRAR